MVGVLVAAFIASQVTVRAEGTFDFTDRSVEGFDLNDFFSSPTAAYQLLPPVCIAQGRVKSFDFSPNGRYVTYTTERLRILGADSPAEGSGRQMSYCIWDSVTGKTATVLFYNPDETFVATGDWFGDSSALLVSRSASDKDGGEYYRGTLWDAKTGKVMPVPSGPNIKFGAIVNSQKPFLWRTETTSDGSVNSGLLLRDGSVKPLAKFTKIDSAGDLNYRDPFMNKAQTELFWHNDFGKTGKDERFAWGHIIPLSGGASKAAALDFAGSQFEPPPEGVAKPIGLVDRFLELRMMHKIGCNPRGLLESAIVTLGEEKCLVCDDLKKVVFIKDGCLMMRAIRPVPLKQALELATKQRIGFAMAWAQEVILDLITVADQLEDSIPNNSRDLRRWLTKRMHNPYLFESFVFSYKGGPLSAVTDPANCEIGYVLMPDGRAVAYADGSVKWVPFAPGWEKDNL